MKNTEHAPGHWRESITNPSNDVTSFSATAPDYLVVCDPFTSHKEYSSMQIPRTDPPNPDKSAHLHS